MFDARYVRYRLRRFLADHEKTICAVLIAGGLFLLGWCL